MVASPPPGVNDFLLLSVNAIRGYMIDDMGPFWNQSEMPTEQDLLDWLEAEVDARKS